MSKRGAYDLGLTPAGGLALAGGRKPASSMDTGNSETSATERQPAIMVTASEYDLAIEELHHDGTRGS